MVTIKKIKRVAFVLFAAVSLVSLWFIIDSVRSLLLITSEWNAVSVAFTSIGALITLLILIIALITLYSTKADETPFNRKNVKRLRAMAILLAIYEPFFLIYQLVFQKLYPIVLADGTSVTVHSSMGGVVLVAGLVVFCVSLVFEYGISLQQQVDETL